MPVAPITAKFHAPDADLMAELVAPAPDVMVLRIGNTADCWMPVARATLNADGWRVRALIGGHEQLVASVSAARQCLLEALREAFPALQFRSVVGQPA
jgi:hypothetical protein